MHRPPGPAPMIAMRRARPVARLRFIARDGDRPGHRLQYRSRKERIMFPTGFRYGTESSAMARVPVSEGVFTASDEPRLIGRRCGACGIVTFPAQESCPRCASIDMTERLLQRRGRLWAWTTQ